MPSKASVEHRCRLDPEFRAVLAVAARKRRSARIKAALEARRLAKEKRHAARAAAAHEPSPRHVFDKMLSHNAIYRAVKAVVPASLPPITRDDVIGDMVLAVLEGDLAMNDLKARAKTFVKEHWRMFGTLRDVSFDAQLFSDGRSTLGDRVSGHGADYW